MAFISKFLPNILKKLKNTWFFCQTTQRHSRVGGNLEKISENRSWIPACAGMTAVEKISILKKPLYKKRLLKHFLILLCFCFIPQAFSEEMTLNNQEMQELVRDFRIDIQQSPSIMRGPLVNDYIQHLGMTLARHAEDINIHYAFFVNDSNEINAFAGPGGTIVINSALILATKKEDELAAVMAHEIAHSEQKHWLKDINRQQSNRISMLAGALASVALGLISPALATGAAVGGMTQHAQSEINHTRSHEKEADRIGIQLLYEAGYNPKGMVDFLKKLQQYNQYHDMSNIPPILLTHPLDEVRIADAQNRIDQLPKKQQYRANPDYFLIKEIIRVLTSKKPSSLIPFYQEQLSQFPNAPAFRYGYAITLIKTLKFSQAEAILKSLLRQSPHNYYYLLALSACELGLKNTSQALTLLAGLYNSYPDNLAIIKDYSTALIQFNQYQKAEMIIKDGLNDYPNNINLLKNLAQVQSRSHQTARAYLTRAKIFLQLGQTREAGIALRAAKKSVQNDPLLEAQIDAQIKALKEIERLQDEG